MDISSLPGCEVILFKTWYVSWYIYRLNPSIQQDLFFIESFAGTAQATRSVQSMYPEHTTAALDIKFSDTMDLTSESGMGNLGLLFL